jgi:nucleotide-binding universal stress UspA family protein
MQCIRAGRAIERLPDGSGPALMAFSGGETDMSTGRRAYEAGHKPKFLAVVDDSPECAKALRFALRRTSRTGSGLVLLAIAPPPEGETWLGVGDMLRAEAEEEAQALLDRAAAALATLASLAPELIVRTGHKADEILALIEQDHDIAILVLAAGTGRDGPGPLVTALAGRMAGTFPVPIAIVPGHLEDAEIDALA